MACKPGSVPRLTRGDDHSSGVPVAGAPRATYPDGNAETRNVPSLFGLAPGGACRAVFVAEAAVRSYRTVSTLPALSHVGGLISVALSLESPPPDVIRHRVSVEPGLSSPSSRKERPSGHLTRGQFRCVTQRSQSP